MRRVRKRPGRNTVTINETSITIEVNDMELAVLQYAAALCHETLEEFILSAVKERMEQSKWPEAGDGLIKNKNNRKGTKPK